MTDKKEEQRLKKNARSRQRYHENIERERLRGKEYRLKNPEKEKARSKKDRELNPNKWKIWRLNNPNYYKKYYAKNPDKNRQHLNKRRSEIKKSESNFTAQDIEQMLVDQDGLCAYCECNITEGYHVDHMMPLSREGSNNWDNIAIVCPSCNLKKNTKTSEEFMEIRYDRF